MHLYLMLCSLFVCDILQCVTGNLPDIPALCPYNDFCTTKAKKTLSTNESDLMPCCQKCSCEADCQLFGNCCPDKQLIPDVQTKYPCQNIDLFYNLPRRVRPTTTYDLYYHIIDDCPKLVQTFEYPRCFFLEDLEDYILVSDPLTGRIYQNKHCAMCHGVTEYVEWHLVTDCPDKADSMAREEWFLHVMKNCAITPIPPISLTRQEYQCFPTVKKTYIQKCNNTGNWKTMDADVLDACEQERPQVNDMFYYENQVSFLESSVAYENVYCKICNEDVGEQWPDLCPQMLGQVTGKKSHTSLGFSVVINFKYTPEIVVEPQCNTTQVWDHFKKSCMTIICPAYSSLIGSRCLDMFKRFSEETYGINFRIESKSKDFTLDVLEVMHTVVYGLIDNENCVQCESNLLYQDNGVYLHHYVRTQKGCSSSYLVQQVKALNKKRPIEVYYSNVMSNITLILDLNVKNVGIDFGVAPLVVNSCPNGFEMDWKLVDRCPRISLTYAVLNTTEHNIETENDGTMCLDEYYKIMLSINSSNIARQYHLMTMCLILVSYVSVHF